ncbi:MAG: response regulator [Myxococcales bacterium]|nr:response regulator [Myxococcales bacterium]
MPEPPPAPPGKLAPGLLSATDGAGVGVAVVRRNARDRHEFVSEAAARLLGYEQHEIEQLGPSAYLAADTLAHLEGEPTASARWTRATLRRRDGAGLRARVAKATSDDGLRDVFVFRDIGEQERVVEELARARSNFQRLLDAAPDGVAVVGRSGLLYVNPVLLRWVGVADLPTLANTRIAEVIHTHDVERAVQTAKDLLESPNSRHVIRMRIRRRGGGLFEVECLGLATEWEGEPACLVVARDLSQRRHDQSRVIAADRSASLGTLSAGVAHEINNPLAYLLLNLEYLIRELPRLESSPERLAHFSERLAESRHGAERVGHILKELSSLSGRRRNQHRGVDVGEVVKRALRTTARDIDQRAQLVCDNLGVPRVDADPSSLEQLFVNLLLNATQALPESRRPENEITVRLSTGDDGGAEIEISDNGVGIQPDHLSRIFDPFFTTKPSGTGLGLPISHAIVRSLGGTIVAVSELGRGTTFKIALPRGTQSVTESQKPESGPHRGAERARVLVVDDDALVAETLSRALADDYDVRVCTRAADALALLGTDRGFDLVLCDLLMPEMSGMELHGLLAQRHPGLEERLVFMTGGAFTRRAREFLLQVENPRLEKPFEVEQFHSIVRDRLAKR